MSKVTLRLTIYVALEAPLGGPSAQEAIDNKSLNYWDLLSHVAEALPDVHPGELFDAEVVDEEELEAAQWN